MILQLQQDSSGYVRPSTFCMSSMVVRFYILGALVDNGGNLDLENGQSEVIRLTGVVA